MWKINKKEKKVKILGNGESLTFAGDGEFIIINDYKVTCLSCYNVRSHIEVAIILKCDVIEVSNNEAN